VQANGRQAWLGRQRNR